MDPNGRGVVFTIHPPRERIHGIASLVDDEVIPHDVTADEPATVLAIPIAAIRAEMESSPALWESVAKELTARFRAFIEEVRVFLLKPLRPRLAGLLLSLTAPGCTRSTAGPVAIGLHLPQERLGEMLGVSRQTATGLVRELVDDGLVHWRYGRVTLLDLPRLQAIAAEGGEGVR
jgi:CRP-like cAMP-binding protein